MICFSPGPKTPGKSFNGKSEKMLAFFKRLW